MTIFFYKGLMSNPEIGNTPIWILPDIWRLEWVRDTKLGTNFSNETLLNDPKCQCYSFYRFWVIKGKTTDGVKPPSTHIRVSLSTFLSSKRIVIVLLQKKKVIRLNHLVQRNNFHVVKFETVSVFFILNVLVKSNY